MMEKSYECEKSNGKTMKWAKDNAWRKIKTNLDNEDYVRGTLIELNFRNEKQEWRKKSTIAKEAKIEE